MNAWYAAQVAAGKTAAQINATSRSSTSGIATTTTATATSTSRTATSTTSSRSTPAWARRPAAAPRARRDLVAPLVRVLHQHRRRRARRSTGIGGVQDRDVELLDRRLHDRAGERRRRRVRARVRARPRSPGRVRHVGQHRRRRERHGLLDAHVQRLVRQQRHGVRGHRRPAVPHERLGQVPARVAQLRGCPGRAEVRAQARAVGHEHQAGAGRLRPAAGQEGHRQPRVHPSTGPNFYYSGSGNDLDDQDDEAGHARAPGRSRPRSGTPSRPTGTTRT